MTSSSAHTTPPPRPALSITLGRSTWKMSGGGCWRRPLLAEMSRQCLNHRHVRQLATLVRGTAALHNRQGAGVDKVRASKVSWRMPTVAPLTDVRVAAPVGSLCGPLATEEGTTSQLYKGHPHPSLAEVSSYPAPAPLPHSQALLMVPRRRPLLRLTVAAAAAMILMVSPEPPSR